MTAREQLADAMREIDRVRDRLTWLRDESPRHGPQKRFGTDFPNRIVHEEALSAAIRDLYDAAAILDKLLASATEAPPSSAFVTVSAEDMERERAAGRLNYTVASNNLQPGRGRAR